jgi:hypothetical protein
MGHLVSHHAEGGMKSSARTGWADVMSGSRKSKAVIPRRLTYSVYLLHVSPRSFSPKRTALWIKRYRWRKWSSMAR